MAIILRLMAVLVLLSLMSAQAQADEILTIQGTSTPAPKPDMVVSGNGQTIVNGDDTPAFSDNTDFGSRQNGRESVEKTFQIDNGGTADLNLIGTPKVVISGDAAGDFTVTTEPGSPLGTTQQTAFKIRFAPSATGERHAIVSIANDDPDADPYTFAIQGTGTNDATPYRKIEVLGHDHTSLNPTDEFISTGDCCRQTHPSIARGNIFGSAPIGTSVEHTFKIRNSGIAAVTISEITFDRDYYTLELPDQWTVSQMPLSPLPSGDLTEFKITFTPKRLNDPVSLRDEQKVIIRSNDRRTNRSFYVQGIATPKLQPHMVVSGSGSANDIRSGDHTPETNDNTDFGSVVAVGSQFHDLSFTISNSSAGEADLNLTGTPLVEILGAAASDFTVTQPVSSTLVPNTQSEFTIRFDPSAEGLRHATVSIINNDPLVAPYTFAIQGNGALAPSPNMQMYAAAGWMLTNNSLKPAVVLGTDFGSTSIGSSGVEIKFVIANEHHHDDNVIGLTDLNLTGTPLVEILGAAASDFTVTQQPVSPVLQSDDTILKILFQPSVIGLRHATVSIANDDLTANPYTFAIQGIGTPELKPHMVVVGDNHNIDDGDVTPAIADHTDFGSVVNDGSQLQHLSFIINNSGTADLNLTGALAVEILGEAAGDFSVETNPHSPVAPYTHTVFDIVFRPSIDGLRHATVRIANDDPTANPYTFAIQGRGTPEPKPHITVSGDQHDIANKDTTPESADNTKFGSATIGGSSVERTFHILNSGTANLHLTGKPEVAISGTAAGDFTVITQPFYKLTPGGSTPFIIRFTPGAAGLRHATVTIANSDADRAPFTFAIQGTGTAAPKPHMSVSGNQHNIVNSTFGTSPDNNTDFGGATIGGSVEHTFQILNSGTADLDLTSTPLVVIAGAATGDFAVITPPATTIAPGTTSPFTIRFMPGAEGLRHVFVTIANSDASNFSYYFDIQGKGTAQPEPHINVTGDQLNIANQDKTPDSADNTEFGSATIGVGVEHTFHILNNGDADLDLTGTPVVAITGAAAGDFALITPPLDAIAPDTSSPFSIRFMPGTEGLRHATVTIANSDADKASFTFAIQGTGTADHKPHIVVSGDQHNIANLDTTPSSADNTEFGSATIGGSSVEHKFQIKNSGTANLHLTGAPEVAISGTAAGDFTVITPPFYKLTPGVSTPFIIRFTPGAAGVRAATVTIANSDADKTPFMFAIQGTGTAVQKPHMVVSGKQHNIVNEDLTPAIADNTDFGGTISGSGSVEKTFQINNIGTADLNLTGTQKVAISGAAAGDFSVTVEPGSPLGPNHQAVFSIRFAPSADGLRTATVSIANDDPDANPYTFTIQGTGTAVQKPHMVVSGNQHTIVSGDATPAIADNTDFGDTTSGGVEKTFQINNGGTDDLNLTDGPKVAISGAAAGDFSVTVEPASLLGPNHQAVFSIRFAPSRRGLRTAMVSIANNDPDVDPYTFAIQGTGIVYTVNVNVVGAGNVHSTPNGIDCGTACEAQFLSSEVILYAHADSDADSKWTLESWGADCAGSVGTTCNLSMDSDKSATATFTCVHLSIPAQLSIVTKEEYECFDIEVNNALEILTKNGDVIFHAENSISIGPGFRVGNEAKLTVNTGL